MKYLIAIFVISVTFVGCSPSLTYHDPFTKTDTVRSNWLDSEELNPYKFFKISAVHETVADGTSSFCLDVAVANSMHAPYISCYPKILEHQSLQLLVDDKPMFFSTKKSDIVRFVSAGFLCGWQVEQARYRGITAEDLLKIAAAKEVKVKVCCQTPFPHVSTLNQKTKNEIEKFVKEKMVG